MINIPAPLLLDGYKVGHAAQYPHGTEYVYSNLTARKSRVPDQGHVVNFGIQYFCLEYLRGYYNKSFFHQPKEKVVAAYRRRLKNYLGTEPDTSRIEALHDLGYLPIRVKTLPEGTLVPMRVANLTIENTLPEFFWLTNALETILSSTISGAITSATTAIRFRRMLTKYADETVGNRDFVPWQGHDFSMRGVFSFEQDCISGAAHLLSFTGTDTIPAIDFLETYYGADSDAETIGGSIPATEHSVQCAGGEVNEYDTYLRLLTEVYPSGPVSIVSDTWDYWNVLTDIIPRLKDVILARDGKLVVRPDSGDGVEVVAGRAVPIERINSQELARAWRLVTQDHKYDTFDPFYVRTPDGKFYEGLYSKSSGFFDSSETDPTPELKGSVEVLWDLFGGTTTNKGFRLLDSHIGVILGEGVGIKNGTEILERLKAKGFASINVVYGIGSYAYQYVTRDTYGLAMKATWCQINGEAKDIFKNPKTDVGSMKKSAKGLLQVKRVDGKLVMRDQVTREEEQDSLLETVFENGRMIKTTTLAEIRTRLAAELDAPPAADLSQVSDQGRPATGEVAKAI